MTLRNDKCFIIAGGPSLADFDFSQLHDQYTIGINKAFAYYPVSAVYAMDFGFYSRLHVARQNEHWTRLAALWRQFRGMKYLIRHSDEEPERHRNDPTYCFIDLIKKPMLTFDLAQGIYIGNNSGTGALCLAIALGYREIYLLGYDMKVDVKNRRTHWHEGYPERSLAEAAKETKTFINDFMKLATLIRQTSVKVVNLNPDSALDCFPKAETWQ